MSRDLEETVGINLKGGYKLGLSTGHGGDASELELSEETIVAALGALTLVDGEGDSGLVVLDGGEDTRLVGGDGGVTGNDNTEDITLHGDTEGKRGDVEEKEVLGLLRGLASEDSGLDGSTVGNGLIGVDGLVELTATEELGDEGLDLGDTGGATDKDDVIDLVAGDLRVLQDLLDGVDGGLEESGVDLLETGTSEVGGEVLTLVKGVNLDGGLGDGGEGPLGTLARGAETTESAGIIRDVELVLLLELVLEELEEVVVKVLTTKMGVARGGLDGEDTTRDVQEGDIESSSTEIEDEDVLLGLGLTVETVGDGGSGGLVDDTENLETSDGTSILGGETLGVVEVGRDAV